MIQRPSDAVMKHRAMPFLRSPVPQNLLRFKKRRKKATKIADFCHVKARIFFVRMKIDFCLVQRKHYTVFVFVNLWGSINESSLLGRSKPVIEGRGSPSWRFIVMFVVYIGTLSCVSFF